MQKLGTTQLLALGVGTIIGVGWIVAVGDWILAAGVSGAMIAFLFGAFAVSVIAGCYGDASDALARPGGEAAIVAHAFGSGSAYAVGSALMIAYLGAIVFEAAALGWIIAEIAETSAASRQPWVIAIQVSAILLFTHVNSRGTQLIGSIQTILTALKILGFVAMIGCGIMFGTVSNLQPDARGPIEGGLVGILALAATSPFWYAGFNVIAQTSADRAATMSTSHVAKVMVSSVIIAGILYVAMIASVGSLIPAAALAKLPLPAADAFAIATGIALAKDVVLLIGLVGILAAWNAMTFATVRILDSALARASVGGVRARRPAVLHPGLIAAAFAGALGAGGGRDFMSPAINASAAALCCVFALVSAAVLRSRWQEGRGRRIRPALSLTISCAMFGTLFIEVLTAPTVPVEWIILAIAAAFFGMVWIRVKRSTPALDGTG